MNDVQDLEDQMRIALGATTDGKVSYSKTMRNIAVQLANNRAAVAEIVNCGEGREVITAMKALLRHRKEYEQYGHSAERWKADAEGIFVGALRKCDLEYIVMLGTKFGCVERV